jgi:hypothetical protein
MLTVEQLQKVASMLIKAYRTEIVTDEDWWFYLDDCCFNIHNNGRECTGHYSTNVYKTDSEGITDYSNWIDLQPTYLGVSA